LSTVRVYKVAELLDIPSNDVLALLKKNHGIELKSASSTLEEIVARQFVERMAKQKGITLPKGDMFSEQAVKQAKTASKAKAAPGKKGAAAPAPEPPKPAAPTLGPPRLIKKAKPAEPKPEEAVAPPVEAPAPPPVVEEAPVEAAPAPVAEAPPAEPAPVESVAAASVEPAAEIAREKAGRFVPPSIRLRVEEPGKAPPSAPPLQPKRQLVPQPPRVVPPAPPRPPQAATGNLARPQGQRPYGSPRPPQSNTAAMLGGPRPLPSQPVRPTTGLPQRPGQPPMRPGFRPQQQHRPPGLKPAQKREALQRPQQAPAQAAPPPITRTITFSEGMTVKDLADRLEVRVKDALKALLDRRLMMTINSAIDLETAKSLAANFGAEIETRSFEQEIIAESDKAADPKDLVTRWPVVTIMGHVDHGKTTLLDSIRETRVAEREAGGITQHIGAYLVSAGEKSGKSIVFLDTPGHSAFTMMRARGAKITDVVVLVVAADDGVMPQTKEAIDHAKAANVKIIVAVNKIDKPGANPETVKRQLTDLGLMPEDWGGQTVFVEVSAKKKTGIDTLLEMILLVTELDDLKANPKRSAIGTVIETKLDKGRGPVATVLIQDGTLRVGDNVIAGPVVGKVRALIDDRGRNLKQAGPSTPVELLGLESLPSPGDGFQQVADAAKARQIATFRQGQAKDKALGAKGSRLTLESLQAQLSEEGLKDLPLIIKADVQGSAEVLADTLAKLTDDKTRIKIIHSAVGAINESDVLLATASNAIIIGFNVRPDRNAADVAEREKVDIRQHSVIYHVTDEIKKAMTGLLEPTFKEQRIGIAQVRETFKVPKVGTIAGCMVTDGRITRQGDAQARLLRDNVVVWEGKLASLKRFKDDVSEVKSGFECGLGLQNFNDVKVGDVIEVFQMERVAQPA
jgi:translation initiation factor IF-2